MNHGLMMTTWIACIVAMPCAGGCAPSTLMMQTEKDEQDAAGGRARR
jgi:hypothetical protein